jgi:hypothetical protein
MALEWWGIRENDVFAFTDGLARRRWLCGRTHPARSRLPIVDKNNKVSWSLEASGAFTTWFVYLSL